ncbi:hypothetical protein ACLB2K_026473 [Fragaria x ananassa]
MGNSYCCLCMCASPIPASTSSTPAAVSGFPSSERVELMTGFSEKAMTLKIIKAMKEAGCLGIQRTEADRGNSLPPFEAVHVNKRKIRRATEAAGISYTYASANTFASYFVDFLLHPHEKRKEVIVYGSGEAKGTKSKSSRVKLRARCGRLHHKSSNRSEASQPVNQIMICRQQENIVSQLELISAWRKRQDAP